MRCTVVLVAAAFAFHPATVRAQTPPAPNRPFGVAQDAPPTVAPPSIALRLHYERVPDTIDACPDDRGLRGAIAAKLGYDPISPGPGALPLLHVDIFRKDGAFTASAEKRDASGRMEWKRPPLADADCRRLVDVLGLALAIALHQEHEARVHQAAAPVDPSTPPVPPPTDPSPPARRPLVRLGLRAGVAFGSLASPAPTLAMDLGVGWPWFSVAAEGRADFPVTATVDRGARLRTSVLAGSLVPCGHYRWFAGCGLVSVGVLRAAAENLSVSKEDAGVYAAVGLRASAEWTLPAVPSLALRASADMLVTLHPMTAIRTDDRGKLWATPPVAGLIGAGLVAKF